MQRQSGYALIVILFLLAMVLIALSVAVQPALQQAQREKEEELLFRGEQYKRAIRRFYAKHGRYPLKVEELLWTNDRGYLRRPYPEPMVPDGKWRLIRVGPSGELIGSRTGRTPPTQPPGSEEKEQQAASATSSSTGSSTRFGGGVNAPIIGVASNSEARSFRVYDGYSNYSRWEFIYDPAKDAMRAAAAASGAEKPDKATEGKSSDTPKSGTSPRKQD